MIFHQILSQVFGSILIVQILAHLPLTDINMSANVLQIFQIMISIVSFDYFSPNDYIDFKFTKTPSWSPNFELLGYKTCNYFISLGSIAVFATLQLMIVILAVGLRLCKVNCPCKKGNSIFGV